MTYKWVVLSNTTDRDGGSLAEADGQRNRASVALGSPGECALRWANVLPLDAGVGCSFSAGAAVALSDNEEWSLYGAPRLQPVANRSQIARPRKRLNQAKTVAA